MVYCHVNIEARDERAGQREREASPLRMINYAGRREKLIPRLSLGGKKRCLGGGLMSTRVAGPEEVRLQKPHKLAVLLCCL